MPAIKTFKSSDSSIPDLGELVVNLWPDIPQIELFVKSGQRGRGNSSSVIFRGEDVGKFVRWLSEPGFKE